MLPSTAISRFTSSKTRCSTARPSASTAPSAWRRGRHYAPSSSPRKRGPISAAVAWDRIADTVRNKDGLWLWVPAQGRDDDGWETRVTQPLLIEHNDGVD